MIKWDKRASSRIVFYIKKNHRIIEDFLSQNNDLLDSNEYDELFYRASKLDLTPLLTSSLLISEIDPLPFMHYIPAGMFKGIPLLEIILPEGINEIRIDAFMSSFELRKCVLPKSIKHIYSQAFEFTSLTEIEYMGTREEWGKIEKGDQWNWLLPRWSISSNEDSKISRVICTDGIIEV